MQTEELMKIIRNGENSYVEFKEERIRPRDLAEEIVAFANSEGGIILLGVCDDGNILGVLDKDIEEKIMNICRNNCIPSIIPDFQSIEVDNKIVAVITVSKGLNKPYYSTDHRYYLRVGSTKRIASREELLTLFQANGSLHYDISPVEGTSINDLNLDVVRDYFLKYNAFDLHEESKEVVERILTNADMMTESNNKLLCTVGGLLVFGKSPEKRLPQSGVIFAHFRGSRSLMS